MNPNVTHSAPSPHVLTVDLEDWFHCLEPDPRRWSSFSRRLEVGTERLLQVLDANNARATFFVLGDCARHHPQLVKRIAALGHEIGSHGMEHRFLYTQKIESFRADLRTSVALLSDLTGRQVETYRAPYFSITDRSLWGLDVLKEEGIRIDSSIHPVRNHRYGIPAAHRLPHWVRPGLLEWPVATLPTPLGNVPIGGGVYLRLWPFAFLKAALSRLEARGEPILLYIHPWELDPDQPRLETLSSSLRFRHYYGLTETALTLERLLSRAPYRTLSEGASCLEEAREAS